MHNMIGHCGQSNITVIENALQSTNKRAKECIHGVRPISVSEQLAVLIFMSHNLLGDADDFENTPVHTLISYCLADGLWFDQGAAVWNAQASAHGTEYTNETEYMIIGKSTGTGAIIHNEPMDITHELSARVLSDLRRNLQIPETAKLVVLMHT
jgi:hypothetical protein